ncbi:MAG: tRNA (guanosine(37)-N1)-methyltransferase TrmD [Candidatus Pacebacteria bacterium]|nr:tRNA (guanosine(37)-N1)-methyltransferase TrmD [Candidatus Paceibacterota bacterium]MDQ5922522.1 tRNA (guanine37-N1)-methyltransferase [Patescibacteria group bacterium]
MRFHVITIFPEMFDSYLKESILGRAINNKLVDIKFYNPRDFIKNPKNGYRPVDDKPYGGGPGMVMRAEPMIKAIEKAVAQASRNFSQVLVKNPQTIRKNSSSLRKVKIIIFSPSGKKFITSYAKQAVKKYTDIILICGRYEGIDARVKKIFKAEDISIGDYVLTGGEIPAMVMIDSIARQVKGVLGKYESLEEERVSTSEVYTRPEVLKHKNKNYKVPKVLLSGNHKKIEEWKEKSKIS